MRPSKMKTRHYVRGVKTTNRWKKVKKHQGRKSSPR